MCELSDLVVAQMRRLFFTPVSLPRCSLLLFGFRIPASISLESLIGKRIKIPKQKVHPMVNYHIPDDTLGLYDICCFVAWLYDFVYRLVVCLWFLYYEFVICIDNFIWGV